MLSVPIPSEVSGARIESSISSTGLWQVDDLSFDLEVSSLMYSTHLSFVMQSQIPSQASIINLSSGLLSLSVISG